MTVKYIKEKLFKILSSTYFKIIEILRSLKVYYFVYNYLYFL